MPARRCRQTAVASRISQELVSTTCQGKTCYALQPTNVVSISDCRGNNLNTVFLCGRYVSILRDAYKLHDIHYGITDELRFCVKETSLIISVSSIFMYFFFHLYAFHSIQCNSILLQNKIQTRIEERESSRRLNTSQS